MKVELNNLELTVIITSLHLKSQNVKDKDLAVQIEELADRLQEVQHENKR
jgi:hypothetical protein